MIGKFDFLKERFLKIIDINMHQILLFIIAIIYAIWIGLRPIDGGFGDTLGYAIQYNNLSSEFRKSNGEYGFNLIMNSCRPFLNATGFFIVIALGYFLCTAYSLKKMLRGNGYGKNHIYGKRKRNA